MLIGLISLCGLLMYALSDKSEDKETAETLATTAGTSAETKETTVATTSKPIEISDDSMVIISEYIPDVYIELRYASENNFTGQVIYDFTEPSLRYGTVKKLAKVQEELNKMGYSLKIWDAYRPLRAQNKLWEICPNPAYVSEPGKGYSGHCRGNIVDVTLVFADGADVEMPSDFDEFSKLADRDYSDVSDEAEKNALLLQKVMEENGFKGYSGEWWHFTDTVTYPIIED